MLARPVSVRERAVKWARRRPAVAGLLAGIVLLTATVLAVITGLYRNAVWQAGEAAREARRAQQQEALAGRQKNRAEEQLDRAERLLYATQIQAAQREWEAGNVALARAHLESCRWDFRKVEYRYLFTLFNDNHVTLKGHKGQVGSVAISGDGTRIVSVSEGEGKVWDARTGKDLLTLKERAGIFPSVAISSDGTAHRLREWGMGFETQKASWGEVSVWDARTGKEILTFKGHTGPVSSVAISSDDTRIVSGSGGWILRQGRVGAR